MACPYCYNFETALMFLALANTKYPPVKRFCFLLLLIITGSCVSAQPLKVDSVHILPSECYNNGSIAIDVSGGAGPYNYVITTGPILPNITYPLFADSANYFASLHAGNYNAQITDGGGNTLNYPFTIPGNYQFPLLSTAFHLDTIYATASLGSPPYTFSISTVGPTGPFGPTQNSGIFILCNGTYYVRATDACGNFYTSAPVIINQNPLTTNATCLGHDSITTVTVYIPDNTYGHPPFRYILKNGGFISSSTTNILTKPSNFSCPDTLYTIDRCNDTSLLINDCSPLKMILCSNFSDSSALINATGGSPPYTYRFYAYDSITAQTNLLLTQDSAQFTHLPYPQLSSRAFFEVTDECGRRATASDAYLNFRIRNECPFNGKATIDFINDTIGTNFVSCISCAPVQTLSTQQPFFTGLDTGNYTIRVTDACGETRDKVFHLPDTMAIKVFVEFTSCNDVEVVATSSDNIKLTTGVTFTLTSTAGISDTNTTGLFPNLGTDVYTINAHYDGCIDDLKAAYVPYFTGYCTTPYFDTTCQFKTIVTYQKPDFAEHYELVAEDGTHYYETPPDDSDGVYFDIVPGRYTIKSDSGCEANQEFGYSATLTEAHSVNCLNLGTISLYVRLESNSTCSPQHPFIYSLQNTAGNFLGPQEFISDTAKFYNLDTGLYIARVYLQNDPVIFAGDTLKTGNRTCALDRAFIRILPHRVPILIAQNVTVCGPSQLAVIPFTIQDGFAPYTVSVVGYTAFNITDTFGTIPGLPIGNYTIITNDTCGISSSLNISVIDSCIDCDTIHAAFTASDTLFCAGDTLKFQATDTLGLHYRWVVNNLNYGDSTYLNFEVTTAGALEVNLIGRRFACYDTATKFIQPAPLPFFELGADTILCEPINFNLSSGLPDTRWNTNELGPAIIAQAAGWYWAEATGRCGTFTDSIKIEEEQCDSELDVPGAFTPNGDGNNDYFTVFGSNLSSYDIKIYNRWGELVYQSADATELNNLSRGWNGTLYDAPQSTGTFAYYITARGSDGKLLEKKGNLTLIR